MTVGLTVKDIAETDSVDTIILRSKTDAILKKQNVTSNDRHSPRVISADFEVPLEPFRITIQGTDKDGNNFRRTSKELVTPVTGIIDILPLADDLIKGLPSNVYVNVTNTGSSLQTFDIMAFDTENYLQLPKQTSLTLSPHNSTTVVFKLIGSKKLSITDLTLELRMGYEIIQKKQISVMVKDSIPPIFTTIKKSHACSETIMNNVNCSLGR